MIVKGTYVNGMTLWDVNTVFVMDDRNEVVITGKKMVITSLDEPQMKSVCLIEGGKETELWRREDVTQGA